MRRMFLAIAVAMTVALPGGAMAQQRATVAKVCHRGTPARIDGRAKCLQAGEYCSLSAERQYERYGYECSRRYRPPRLRRR